MKYGAELAKVSQWVICPSAASRSTHQRWVSSADQSYEAGSSAFQAASSALRSA